MQLKQKSGDKQEQGGPRSDDEPMLKSYNKVSYHEVDHSQKIKFGETTFNEYSKISVLGRGTYGEVTRCMHNPTKTEVAIKTFFFDVILKNSLKIVECSKWHQLFNNERDFASEKFK